MRRPERRRTFLRSIGVAERAGRDGQVSSDSQSGCCARRSCSIDAGLLSPELAAGIRRVKGVRRIGVRLGNWLTPEQGRRLLEVTTPSSPRQLRDQAMVASEEH